MPVKPRAHRHNELPFHLALSVINESNGETISLLDESISINDIQRRATDVMTSRPPFWAPD